MANVLKFCTPKVLTKWHMQRVQTKIRLLLKDSLLLSVYIGHKYTYETWDPQNFLTKQNSLVTEKYYMANVLKFCTPKVLTKWHMQRVQTKIRLLLKDSLLLFVYIGHKYTYETWDPQNFLTKQNSLVTEKYYMANVLKFSTPKVLTKWHMQRVQTQIRLLLKDSLLLFVYIGHKYT